jgi:hypothetical protein
LLVDYTNVLRRRDKMELREAVEVAGRTRLRPILMTSLATMLGLVPMALGIGEGSELQVPLARVVIGGLLTSDVHHARVRPDRLHALEEGLPGLWKKRAPKEPRPTSVFSGGGLHGSPPLSYISPQTQPWRSALPWKGNIVRCCVV